LIYTLISPPRLLLSVEDEFAGARRSAMFALAAGLCLASLLTTSRSVTRYSDAPVVGLATIAGSATVGAASLPVALAGIWTAAPLTRSPEIAPRSPEIDRA